MQALVFLGEGKMELRDVPAPEPGPDEVIVAIRASGMCGTDLHHLHEPARPPERQFIEGHEPCGVVAAVGVAVRPAEAKVGDRVIVHHYDGCRACNYCRSGWTQLCPNQKVIFGGPTGDGGHTPYMKVPAHTLIKLPDTLSYNAGAALACGTGTAYGALKRVNLAGDQTVALFGQGQVGLSCTLLAKAFGARVIALDMSDERLELARALGADHCIDVRGGNPVGAIRALTRDGEGADASIECSGNRDARRQSVEAVKRWGTACMVGAFGTIEFDVSHVVQLQKTVLGCVTFSKAILNDAVQYVAERGIDLDRLFTHEFRLDEAEDAYARFARGEVTKGVFVFD